MSNDIATLPAELPPAPNWLERLIEKNIDPAALEKVLEIQERWLASRAKEAFNRAMNQCQQEMPMVLRLKENTQSHTRYAPLEDIQITAKPTWIKHGFSLSFAEAECPTPGWKRTICDVRHNEGHEVRYHIDLPLDGVGAKGNVIGMMNPVQAAVSTGTYGSRVLTARVFNIVVAGEDKDGQGGYIGCEEIAVINDLLAECRDAGHEVNFDRFMKFLEVKTLEEVTRLKFAKAINHLNGKRKGQTKVKTEGGGK